MDGTVTAGRKGLPYDWQALLAEHRTGPGTKDSLHTGVASRTSGGGHTGPGLTALAEAVA